MIQVNDNENWQLKSAFIKYCINVPTESYVRQYLY